MDPVNGNSLEDNFTDTCDFLNVSMSLGIPKALLRNSHTREYHFHMAYNSEVLTMYCWDRVPPSSRILT